MNDREAALSVPFAVAPTTSAAVRAWSGQAAAVFVKEVPLKGAGPKGPEDGKPDAPAAQAPLAEAV